MASSTLAVLHVALNPVTGPWSVMRELAGAQARSGLYRSVGLGVITDPSWPLQYARELESTGLPSFRSQTAQMFGTGQFLWQRWQRPPLGEWIDAVARQSGATRVVVHFHNAWLSGVFLPLPVRPGVRLAALATFHGVNAAFEGQPIRHWLHRRMAHRLERFDAELTTVDAGNLGLARSVLGLDPQRFTVIPNGVPAENAVEKIAWTGSGTLVVGHVGSILERKGWRLVAEAVLRLARVGKAVRLVIAGSGPEEAEARTLAAAHPDLIEFKGFVADPRRNLLPQLHLLTLMSVHEGLPMSLIEAMSVGLPVVATRVGGIPEAIQDGETGRLIDRDSGALASVIGDFFDHPEKLVAMGEKARLVFQERFNIDRIVQRYHEVYIRKIGVSDVG